MINDLKEVNKQVNIQFETWQLGQENQQRDSGEKVNFWK
jgi:hypothetical protein